MKAAAIAILTPVFSGLIWGLWGMYLDVQTLKADDIVDDKAAEKMEKQLDDIHWYLIERNNVKVLKRGK